MTGPVCCDVLSHFLQRYVYERLGPSVERFGESIADDYAYPITGMLELVVDTRKHARTCKDTYREVAVRVDDDGTRSRRRSRSPTKVRELLKDKELEDGRHKMVTKKGRFEIQEVVEADSQRRRDILAAVGKSKEGAEADKK